MDENIEISRNEKFYRNEVLKDFKPHSGMFKEFSYGANSITGWRLGQEDRYLCLPFNHFTRTWSFFGVYDGHGGEEVAEYLKQNLHEHVLEKLKEFGDIKTALSEGFKECDRTIRELTEVEFEKVKSDTKEFPADDYKPSSSNSAASISEELMAEIKKVFLKQMMELQTELSKPSDPVTEKKSMEDEPMELEAACSGSSETVEATNTPESSEASEASALDEKKNEKPIPLVGHACGSTATVVVFTDAIIYVANVGDSRCIASVNGAVKSLSHDHRPLQKKERSRILESGHKIARGRIDGGLNMSRAFGDFGLKDHKVTPKDTLQAVIVEPTICAIEINPDLDFIVVASDGVWNNMENEAVLEFISTNIKLPLTEICEKIFEDVLSRSTCKQGQDNMSMIIIKNDSKEKIGEIEAVEIEGKKNKRLKK